MIETLFGAVAIALCIVWSLFGAYGVAQMRAQSKIDNYERYKIEHHRQAVVRYHAFEDIGECRDCDCRMPVDGAGRCDLCADIAEAIHDFHLEMMRELKAQHPDWPLFDPENHDAHDHENLVDITGRVLKRICLP